MATTSRTFNLSIGGVQTAITSVASLQTTVQTLQTRFDNATFGTPQFDQLQKELIAAQRALAATTAATNAAANGANNAGNTAKKMGSDMSGAFGLASIAGGNLGNVIGQVQGGIGAATNVVSKLQGGFGGLRTAMVALPFGALLIAFGFLVKFLTSSQEGMNFLDRKTKALQAVFQLLSDKAVAVGKALFETFSNPKKALNDLVDGIETNLVNRLKSFSVILDGIINKDFTKITDGFVQMGTGITDATAKAKEFGASIQQFGKDAAAAAGEAERIAISNQQIAREERALNVERAKTDTQLTKLKLIQDDATKSIKARMAATQAAFDLEKPLIDRQLQLQDRTIANLKAEQALKKNLTGEDLDAVAEAEKKRAEIQKASFDKQAELTAKLSGFVQAEKATALAAETAKKAAADKAAAEKKALLDKELADTQAAAAIGLDIQKRQLDAELAAAEKGSQEQLRVLKAQKALETEAALQAVDDKMSKAGAKEKAALVIQREAIAKAVAAAQLKVETDFENERIAAATQNEADLAAVKVLGLQKGTKAYTDALIAQVNAEMFVALGKLEKTKENEAARTKIIADAAKQRGEIEKEATAPADVETSILKNIFGVRDGEVDKVKQAIADTANFALQATTDLLNATSAARIAALDAQTREADDIINASKEAADALNTQLDESDNRINQLEDQLDTARGEKRQRIIDQLTIERSRNAAIHADKAKEDARSKKAEQDKAAIEKQRTAEQEKQQKIQSAINAVLAVGAAISATKAAVDSISAIAAAGAGGKFGFDNIAYILAATGAIIAAGIQVKQAVKGFDRGGFTGGGYGAPDQSGFKVAGVVHENEWVAPKWMVTSPKFSSTLAQLETARVTGGAGYAAGGYAPVTVPAAQQGVDLSILVNMQENIQVMQGQLDQSLKITPVVRPSDLKTYTETQTAINDTFIN